MTTGEAIFLFEDDKDEKWIARSIDGIRLDKRHTLGTCVIRVCKTCHSSTYGQTDYGNALETASKEDPDSCRSCVPDNCCCCANPLSDDIGDIYSTYVSCQPCRENMDKQEAWRNKIPVHDTESSYKEPQYLCSEAIQREKDILGGKAPVSEDWITPFMISYHTDSLVDPRSGNYWPYGMSGKDYVKLQDERRFNNPMCETQDDAWRDIEVTDQVIKDYWERMKSLQTKYDFKSLTEIGSLPTTMSKEETPYRLVPDTHGFTCDDPTCQAIFHQQNDLDGGGYAALVATGLPIYTSRSGDLKSESVSEIGYGNEYCLACMMK